MILKFNEYKMTDRFVNEMSLSIEEISDILIDLEDLYEIKYDPIRFKAKSNMSPQRNFFDGLSTEWSDNSDIFQKNFNGIGYRLRIKQKSAPYLNIVNISDLKRIIRKMNRKRLLSFGAKADIIRETVSFIVIYKAS